MYLLLARSRVGLLLPPTPPLTAHIRTVLYYLQVKKRTPARIHTRIVTFIGKSHLKMSYQICKWLNDLKTRSDSTIGLKIQLSWIMTWINKWACREENRKSKTGKASYVSQSASQPIVWLRTHERDVIRSYCWVKLLQQNNLEYHINIYGIWMCSSSSNLQT